MNKYFYSERVLKFLLLIVMILLIIPVSSSSQGGRPGEFLRFGVGASSLGMGMAHMTIPKDATTIYWNPARLSLLNESGLHFSGSMMKLFGMTNFYYLGFAIPFGQIPSVFEGAEDSRFLNELEKWALGIGYVGYGLDDLDQRDEAGFSISTFEFKQQAWYLSFARRMSLSALTESLRNFDLSFGANMKFLGTTLLETSSNAFSLDLGTNLSWNKFIPLEIGLVGRDLFEPDIGFEGGSEDIIPRTVRVGGSLATPFNLNSFLRTLTLAADYDLVSPLKSSSRWHVGILWQPPIMEKYGVRPLTIRTGYEPERLKFTMGVSIDFSSFGVGGSASTYLPRLDFAYASGPESGMSSANSFLSWDFKKPFLTCSLYYNSAINDYIDRVGDWGESKFKLGMRLADSPPGGCTNSSFARIGDIYLLKNLNPEAALNEYRFVDCMAGNFDPDRNERSAFWYLYLEMDKGNSDIANKIINQGEIWCQIGLQDYNWIISYIQAKSYLNNNNYQQALDVINQVSVEQAEVLLLKARILYHLNEINEAKNIAGHLVFNPQSPDENIVPLLFPDSLIADDALRLLAEIAEKEGNVQEAAFYKLLIERFYPMSQKSKL